MKEEDFLALCMIMAVVSFLGFVVENVWLTATKGFMDNRNMCFPFLFGYGIAIMLIFIIWGTPKQLWFCGKAIRIQSRILKIFVFFVGVMICVCVGEIVLGTVVEKVCHFAWWDYSKLPMHITQYTSIPTGVMFSMLITVFMDVFFEPLFRIFRGLDYNVLRTLSLSLIGIMIVDFLYNAYLMYKTRGMITRWKIDTTNTWLYKKVHTVV